MSGRVKNNLSGFMRGLVVALFILIEIGVIKFRLIREVASAFHSGSLHELL